MGVLRVLGPDQSTVLFDFDDSTGAANPSTVVTNLGAALDLGSVDPALALELRTHGAAILGSPTLPTVEMQIPFMASAATDTALFEGLGQLYRYLLSASRDHPIYLDWTELSATRYIDVVGIAEMPQLIRGDQKSGIVASRRSSARPAHAEAPASALDAAGDGYDLRRDRAERPGDLHEGPRLPRHGDAATSPRRAASACRWTAPRSSGS